ncbi:hypothetical protein [Fibrella aquatica]|uniref:hypothetical protein n=1 Tax=Fibrella aquatica TaxID=3242487 RepID=UPI0035208845
MSKNATVEDYEAILEAIIQNHPSVIRKLDVHGWQLARILLDLGYSPSAFGLSARTEPD